MIQMRDVFAGILIFGVILVMLSGMFLFFRYLLSPEFNRGYCVGVKTKEIYDTNSGWSEVTYEKKTITECIEWENYKP